MVKAKQFDVCRLNPPARNSNLDLVIVLQHDTLAELSSRIIAPLIPVDTKLAIDRATPPIEVQGARYAVAFHLLTVVPLRNLNQVVANAQDQEVSLKHALDLTFFGI